MSSVAVDRFKVCVVSLKTGDRDGCLSGCVFDLVVYVIGTTLCGLTAALAAAVLYGDHPLPQDIAMGIGSAVLFVCLYHLVMWVRTSPD